MKSHSGSISKFKAKFWSRLRAVTPQTAFFWWVYSFSVFSTAVLPVISVTRAYSGAAPGVSR
jgi:hypothetical protein